MEIGRGATWERGRQLGFIEANLKKTDTWKRREAAQTEKQNDYTF